MFDLNLDERKLNRDFINKINFRHYCFIDQDTGQARTNSGFDFLISANNKVIFIEGKKNNKGLSEYQKLTAVKVEKSHSKYFVLRFKVEFADNVCLHDTEQFFKVEGLENILIFLKGCLYAT